MSAAQAAAPIEDGGPGTALEHAVSWLRAAIVAGALRPGEQVKQERVAERTGLSLVPVREALRVLEQEGQVTYRPRRGYFVTELRVADLEEIYSLRAVLEPLAVRGAMPALDDEARALVEEAARDCVSAANEGDVAAELAANRRFHFALFDDPDQPHLQRLIGLLWDSTEAYRAIYYNSPAERDETIAAHDRILDAVRSDDVEALIAELDRHRERGLSVLREILAGAGEST